MSFQLCPKCKGSGKEITGETNCTVCKGASIISEVTGLPPNKEKPIITEEMKEIISTIGKIIKDARK